MFRIVIVLVYFLFSLGLYAKSEFFISGVGASLDYKEYGQNREILDSEESNFGDIVGVELGYGYMRKESDGLYTKINLAFRHLRGTTNYKGAYLDTNDSYGSLTSTTDDTINSILLKVKEIFVLNEKFNFKIGAGIGMYSWERTLSAIQNEKYSWYPLRFEVGSIFRFSKDIPLSFDLTLAYSKGLSPKMKAQGKENTMVFDLGRVDCYELSLQTLYAITSSFSVIGDFTFNFQDIRHSNVIEGYYEPDSDDRQRFIKIGVQYEF